MNLKTLALSRTRHIFTTALVAVMALGTSLTAAAQGGPHEGTPYFQSVICYSASTNQCEALFPAVPAKKILVVEFIASSIGTPTPLSDAEFFDTNHVAFITILHTLQSTDNTGNKIYVASQPMLYFFTAGETPLFAMNAQAGGFEFMSGSVTLTGHLIDAPPAESGH